MNYEVEYWTSECFIQHDAFRLNLVIIKCIEMVSVVVDVSRITDPICFVPLIALVPPESYSTNTCHTFVKILKIWYKNSLSESCYSINVNSIFDELAFGMKLTWSDIQKAWRIIYGTIPGFLSTVSNPQFSRLKG